MDQTQFDTLLLAIDQMIEISEPRTAEYYRGYRQGILIFQYGKQAAADEEILALHQSYAISGDHYLDFYSRGYREGYRGLAPDP